MMINIMSNDQDFHNLKRKLTEDWGAEFGRIRRLICNLTDSRWHSISELIQGHALSHKTVVMVTRLLRPWVDIKEDKVRVKPEYIDAIISVFGCKDIPSVMPLDPYESAARECVSLLRSMEEIHQNLPREELRLDHVLATPLTVVKRALFLARNYDLTETELLFLGDHDMTSLALMQVCPDLSLTVVDIDERLLKYINEIAIQNRWSIRTVFADLRIELPRSLRERFSLVFTDPPYTPAGIRLFLQRALGSLRRSTFSKILFCYGFGEQHPTLGFKVQREIFQLRLVIEAILPYFNHYTRAQAIGSSSALYICRPTSKTWKVISKPAKIDPRIYTHGRSSEESLVVKIPTQLLEKVHQYLYEFSEKDVTFVGYGWPEDWLTGNRSISINQYVIDMLERKKDLPHTRPLHHGSVAINLWPHYDDYFLRTLVISNAPLLLIVTSQEAFQRSGIFKAGSRLRRIIDSKYRFQAEFVQKIALIVATKKEKIDECDPIGYVLRYLLDHQQAFVHNAWREALISWAAKKSIRLTKNQARGIIKQSNFYYVYERSYMSELPIFALEVLVSEVERTLADVESSLLQETG